MKNTKKILIIVGILGVATVAVLSVSTRFRFFASKQIEVFSDEQPSWVGQYLSGYHATQDKDYELAADFFQKSLAGDSKSKTLQSQAMTLLLVAGKFSEAFEIAKTIGTKSDNSLAKLTLIISDIHQKKFKEADKLISEIAKKPEDNTIINQVIQAWVKFALKDYDAAEKIFAQLKADETFPSFVEYSYALFADLSGNKAKASELYDNLMETDQLPIGIASSAYHFYEGSEEKRKAILKKFKNEIQIKQHHRIKTPDEAIAEALLGVGGIIMQEYGADKAASLFRLSLYLNPDLDEAKLLLGSILISEGDSKSANNILRQIGTDSYLGAYAKLAIARNFQEMKQNGKAREYFEALVDVKDTKLDALVSLGDLSREEEDYKTAIEYYNKALDFITDGGKETKIPKKYWAIYFARGVSHERLKNYNDFEEDLQIALKLYPDQPDALNYLAYTWIDLGKNIDEAKEMVGRAYEQKPDDAHIVDSVGWAYFKLGEYDKAVTYIEKAATQMPYDPTVNDHLGDVYWKVGRENEARYQWQRALDNNPDEKQEAALKEKMLKGLVSLAENKNETK
jgi:tetratricopeptide (TPR) repeat protein